MIAVSSKPQQQHFENSDSTDDRSPSSLLLSSSTTAAATTYDQLCRRTSVISFLAVLVVATYHQLCRRTSVLSVLAVLVVSLCNVGSTTRYLSHYSSSSTYEYSIVHEAYLLLQKPNEPPPPAQETIPWSPYNSSTFMSSCLLWMDDNHYLVEWMAYHYTVLPLRRLIMCIDPKSQTSPLSIVERYSSRGLMNVTIWYEDDFYPKEIRNQSRNVSDPVLLFRRRQKNCYLQCMKTLKEDYTIPQMNYFAHTVTPPPPTTTQHHPHATNTTTTSINVLFVPNQPGKEEEEGAQQPPIWVTIYDMDEFIVFNHLSPEPSIGLKELKPTVLELLTSPKNVIARYPNPCVPMSRSSISILESNESDVQVFVPPSLMQSHPVNGMNLKTLRYPYIIPGAMFGKALLDLRYADSERDFRIGNINVHRPLKNHCPKKRMGMRPSRGALGVYHYPGTLEQFTFRSGDARNWTRIPEKYAMLNKTRAQVTESSNARLSWLPGLVDQVGTEVALALLHGAGEVNPL
jgi:hypothetical protein